MSENFKFMNDTFFSRWKDARYTENLRQCLRGRELKDRKVSNELLSDKLKLLHIYVKIIQAVFIKWWVSVTLPRKNSEVSVDYSYSPVSKKNIKYLEKEDIIYFCVRLWIYFNIICKVPQVPTSVTRYHKLPRNDTVLHYS